MTIRPSRIVYYCSAVLLTVSILYFSVSTCCAPALMMPVNPVPGEIILSGTFEEDYEICIRSPDSPCGRFCSVPGGQILVYADFSKSSRWSLVLDSTVQIARPSYHEVRYYNRNMCLEMKALDGFHIELKSVNDLGSDVEVLIELGEQNGQP